jgi:ATP-dependent Zn protease
MISFIDFHFVLKLSSNIFSFNNKNDNNYSNKYRILNNEIQDDDNNNININTNSDVNNNNNNKDKNSLLLSNFISYLFYIFPSFYFLSVFFLSFIVYHLWSMV